MKSPGIRTSDERGAHDYAQAQDSTSALPPPLLGHPSCTCCRSHPILLSSLSLPRTLQRHGPLAEAAPQGERQLVVFFRKPSAGGTERARRWARHRQAAARVTAAHGFSQRCNQRTHISSLGHTLGIQSVLRRCTGHRITAALTTAPAAPPVDHTALGSFDRQLL